MPDNINLELIGKIIREIQAEQRTMHNEIEFINKRLDQIVKRIQSFESIMETRLDQQIILIEKRFDLISEMLRK